MQYYITNIPSSKLSISNWIQIDKFQHWNTKKRIISYNNKTRAGTVCFSPDSIPSRYLGVDLMYCDSILWFDIMINCDFSNRYDVIFAVFFCLALFLIWFFQYFNYMCIILMFSFHTMYVDSYNNKKNKILKNWIKNRDI